MESVYVDETATAAIGSQVAGLAAQGLTSEAAVAAPMTALAPAGADPVSLQASAAFAAEAAKMLAFDAQAQDFIAAAGAALTKIAATYRALDNASGGTLEASATRIAGTATVELGTPIDPGYTPTTPSAPVNPLTPIAPPTPIDTGYTPSTPSAPVNPLTPIAPPTPIDPGYTPITPITPSAPTTPDTAADTESADTESTETAEDTEDAETASETGTGEVIPTPGTNPGGTPTTPPVTPTRPGDETLIASLRESRTSGSASDTTISTPGEMPTGAADSAVESQTPAATTAATEESVAGAEESVAAPAVLMDSVPAATLEGVRPAALSGMVNPASAGSTVSSAAARAGTDEVKSGVLAAGAGPAVAGVGGAPMMPMAPAATSSGGAGPGSQSRPPVGSSTPPVTSVRSAEAARAGEGDDWDDATDTPRVPVSASLAARDAIASADAGRRQGAEALRLARRVAAALHAPDSLEGEDAAFFWVTGVTADDMIVVANNFGLAYIPAGVALPEKVHMATADSEIPAAERAGWVPDPIKAVRGWAAHHRTKLTALIATEEGAAQCEEGSITVVLKPDEIPDSGAMEGRSRLQVVDPEAAQRLTASTHLELPELLPAEDIPAPRDAPANAPAAHPDGAMEKPQARSAERPQPDNSRDIARFRLRVATAHRTALRRARSAAEAATQRFEIAEWLYWKHLVDLAEAATSAARSS